MLYGTIVRFLRDGIYSTVVFYARSSEQIARYLQEIEARYVPYECSPILYSVSLGAAISVETLRRRARQAWDEPFRRRRYVNLEAQEVTR